MIVQEVIKTFDNGVKLIKTYSDTGHYVVNANGDKYAEAIDPDTMHRVYTESDELIPEEEPEEIEEEE